MRATVREEHKKLVDGSGKLANGKLARRRKEFQMTDEELKKWTYEKL